MANEEMGEEVVEITDIVEQKDDEGNDTTDWKALALKNQGIAQRLKTKLEKSKEAKTEAKPNEPSKQKSDDLDYGQLAYLATKGVESSEDIDFVREELKKFGGELKDLVSNEYFQGKLKERKEARKVLDATTTTPRRGNNQAADSVEYHLSKYLSTGKLPEDREMATKVVNANLAQRARKSQFTDNPVVRG